MSLADNQFRAGENGEMRRHRVLGDFDQARQFAGRNAFRLPSDQQSERLQPRRLGERRQGGYGFSIIHISRLPDVRTIVKRLCSDTVASPHLFYDESVSNAAAQSLMAMSSMWHLGSLLQPD